MQVLPRPPLGVLIDEEDESLIGDETGCVHAIYDSSLAHLFTPGSTLKLQGRLMCEEGLVKFDCETATPITKHKRMDVCMANDLSKPVHKFGAVVCRLATVNGFSSTFSNGFMTLSSLLFGVCI